MEDNRYSRYKGNVGDQSRPYGEDYGEDLSYEGGRPVRDDRRKRSSRVREGYGLQYPRRGSPREWLPEHQGFDYGMSRTGSRARIGGFHFGLASYHEEEPYGEEYSEQFSVGGRGYMSDDDYDQGTRRYSENRGYRRQASFRPEGQRYPETYRSAAGGYLSEHVGSDRDRRDYNEDPDHGNLYGTHYDIRSGLHRGKGPKNYRRSDDRIRDEISDRLADDPFTDASDIDVTINNGEVILSGTVFDRTQKRRAEDIVESVSGVTHVENRLRRR